MSHFLYKLVAPRPDFDTTMTEAEADVMGQHAAYWTGQLESGRCVVFGPVSDPAGVWGLAVIEVDDLDNARALALDDPAITSGVCSFDIYPMAAIVRS